MTPSDESQRAADAGQSQDLASGAMEAQYSSSASLESDARTAGVINSSAGATKHPLNPLEQKRHRARQIRLAIIILLLVVGGAIIFLHEHTKKSALQSASTDASKRYSTQTIPLTNLSTTSGVAIQDSHSLSINGQLNVNNGLVLSPTAQPTSAVTGQLYYDQTTNEVTYYNGTSFQTLLAANAAVQSIGGANGNLTTGDGLKVTNGTISNNGVLSVGGQTGAVSLGGGLAGADGALRNTGVLSLQGQAGNVSLTAGGGIAISGTTVSSTGVTALGGQNGDIAVGAGLSASGGTLTNSGLISAAGGSGITVVNDGNGNITISSAGGGGGGTVASPGGTTNKLAKFTGVQTIADSLISDDGTTVTVGGALSVTGAVNLTTALTVANGGTGSTTAAGARTNLGAAKSGANSDITSLTGLTTALTVAQGGTGVGTLATNGVIVGNGVSGLTSVVAGAAGLCLTSTAGAPSFQACPGSGGVASIDGLTGAVTLANSSGVGTTVTINDASTAAKGIASFNATNFLVAAGAVNTVQNIAVTASPTFNALSLTTALTTGNGGTGATTAGGARTNLGAAASGANGDITSLSGLTTALSVLQGGTGTTSLTANGVLLGNGAGAVSSTTGSAGQCLLATAGAPAFGVCPGSGGVTSVDGLSGVITLNNSAGAGGAITINDAGTAQKGLAQFNSTNFSVAAGIVDSIQDIATGSSPTFNGLTLSGALSVNTISPTAAATFGVTSKNLTLQGASTTITSTNGANTAQLKFVAPTANVTYNLQTATGGTYDICTTAGNCVGTGGGVTTAGGTNNKIPKFTGSQTLADSLISDNGTTVTVAGDASVTGTLSLTNALTVANGGTGATSFSSNSVVIGNGSGALSSATTATPGQCLVSTAGAPVFNTCPGSGGVTSVNGLSGVISVANASGAGATITINDASTASKGIASFNSTNFSVSSGAVNTIQDIATTSAPSFGQLTLTSSQAANPMLVVNNTNVAAAGNLIDLKLNGTSKFSVAPSGAITNTGTLNGQTIGASASFTGTVAVATSLSVNAITPTGALTVGATGQSFLLQGNASSTITATNGGNSTALAFQSPTANVTYTFKTAAAGSYDVCTTAGNCSGVGGSVTTPGGTTNTLAKFTSSNGIGDSIISDNGTTVTIAGALSVNTLTPSGALTVGATGQNLTLQGATVSLTATNGGVTNSLTFATPTVSGKTITVPDATGTVAVSASGPLSIDAAGNLTCATCLTSGGGGGSAGVSSLNSATGGLTLQGTDAATVSTVGTTITINDASAIHKGLASFNSTNLTVTSGAVNTVQDIAVTSTPTFGGLTLSSALTVGNGGTGATSASGARTNLGAAASGANSDITSLSGLTTALSTVQGGTGITTTANNGEILIGNGSGYSLNTLTAGSGVTIDNTVAGHITISAGGAGTCGTCANTNLGNLASVAINTSLLPASSAGADLGSGTKAFGQLFLAGTSASPASNNFKLTGVSTSGTRTITLPDASGTVAVSASGYLNLNASTGNLTFVGPLAVTDGGTGASSASGARTNLGAAASGANSDITSITGLTTALSLGQGGTGSTTAAGARSVFGAAASGANSDITSLSGLTTALSVVQGGTGATSFTANGILLGNGSSAVSTVTGSNGQCLVVVSGAPTFTTCPGSGGVTSIDGQTGVVTVSNSSGSGGTITLDVATTSTLGIASFNSTNFSVSSGAVNTIQGISTSASPTFAGLTLSSQLTVANGGTGATSLATNGVIVGQGSSSLTSVTAGGAGLCLISTAGAPSFSACPGSGGVASINSQTGAVTITGVTGSSVSTSAGTITINDATAAVKGLASFNSTNFSVSSGAVNTAQDINSGASPTFNGLSLTTALSIANGGTGATSAGAARTALGAAASGANSDITSLSGLTTALSVIQGGTGAATLTANGVLIGNGTSAVSAVTGTTGQCLIATTGSAPSFQTCTGAGGVASVNSQSGALTLQGTTNQISVSNAGATFTLATPQDINTTSNVTFNNVNATALIQTNGTTRIDASGNLSNIGTIGASGLITGTAGLSISGAAISLNDGSNFNTTINTGTSTGTVTIGNASNTNNAVNINAGATGLINLQAAALVTGYLNASTGFKYNGTAGSTTTCSGGNVLQNATVQGGIITGGTCVANGGGVSPTLQNVYDNSSSPAIIAETSGKGVQIQDFSSTVGNIFAVQSSAGSSTYFSVDNVGAKTNSVDVISGSSLSLGASSGTTIDIGSSGTHTIKIGNVSNAQVISIGSSIVGATTTIKGGDGTGAVAITAASGGTLSFGTGGVANTLQIGTITGGVTQTIGIGNNATASSVDNITIGNLLGGSTTTLQAGTTGGISLQTGSGGSVNIATANTANTVQVGSTTLSSGTQTIGIGNNNTAGGTTNITIGTGATATAGTTTLQGKTSLVLGNATTPLISIQTNSTGSINIGDNNVAETIQIGATSFNGSQTFNIGNNGNVGGSTGSTVLIGSLVNSSGTTIQGGTGIGIKLNPGANGTVKIGDNNTNNTLNIGNSAAAAFSTTLTLATSTGATQTIQIGGTGTGSNTSNANTTVAIQGGATVLTTQGAGVAVQTFANSSSAFQVLGATTGQVFQVDTTLPSANLITNPSFEVGLSGWSNINAGISRDTTSGHFLDGNAANAVNVTIANGGATVTGFTATLTPATYNFSFYALNNNNTGTLSVVVTGGAATCTLASGTLTASGFQRYSCSFTSSGSNITQFLIRSSNTGTFYVDGVQLTSGSATLKSYTGLGAAQVVGSINSPVTLQSQTNSVSAFQIQNSTGTGALLNADTLNSAIAINGDLTVTGSTNGTPFIAQAGASSTNIALFKSSAGLTQVGIDKTGVVTAFAYDSAAYFNGVSGGDGFYTIATDAINSGVTTVNGYNVQLVGGATSGTNTLNGIQFQTVTPVANNVFNAISFGAGTGFSNLIQGTNFNVNGAGALSAAGLITGTAGLSISGAAISLNDGSNFNTTINTGTSTGTVTIGNASNTNNTVNINAGATGGINLQGATVNTAANSTTNIGIGSATAFQAKVFGGGNSLFNIDSSSGNSRVTIGDIGKCFGPGAGVFCVYQGASSGSGTTNNQNNSIAASGTASGATLNASLIELKDTSGNANTFNGLMIDATNTVAANDTFNGIQVTAKASTEAGNLLQLNSATATPVFTVSNAGALTSVGAVQINNSGSANTQIGASTGTTTIGGASAGAFTVQSASTIALSGTNASITSAGNGSLNGSLTVNASNTGTAIFQVNDNGGGSFFKVDTGVGTPRVSVGDSAGTLCGGRFCVAQSYNGTGGGTSTNLFNVQNFTNTVSAQTGISQLINYVDTSTQANKYIAIKADFTTSTNNSVSQYNTIFTKVPTGAGGGGNFLEVDYGATTEYTVNNFGSTTTLGSYTGVGVNSGTGLLQGTGGLTITGTTQINASGAGTTTIGNGSAGAITVQSGGAVNITAGAASTISTGATALTISSSKFNVDSSGNVTASGNITFNGHIISGGSAPTIGAGAAACTTPTVSVAGTDTAGLITVTSGTGCAATGKLATVSFASAFGAAPRVVLTPATSTAAGLNQTYVDSATIATGSFDIDSNTAPANTTTYKWYYHVIQ